MSRPIPPDPLPPFRDSDQQWFDRLTGQVQAAPNARIVHEADALRRVLEQQAAAADADPALAETLSAHATERSWQAIQFRLRREEARKKKATIARWIGAGGALAACVLVATVILRDPELGAVYDEPPALRGALDPVRIPAANPRYAAEALARALLGVGMASTLHQKGTTFSVDVFVEVDASDAAREVLRRSGVATSAAGLIRVEFIAQRAFGR